MANEKVSQMVSLTTPEVASDDLFMIVDSSARESKKIAVSDFLLYVEATGSFNAAHANLSDTASYILGSGIHGIVDSSSFSNRVVTSSYSAFAANANSASWAPQTSGFSLSTGSTYAITSSWALTASKITLADSASSLLYVVGRSNGTASFAISASQSQNCNNALTSSYVVSASFAQSSSFANNSISTSFIAPTAYTVPAGTVITYAANIAPNGWLECDGTAISRTIYAILYTTIGNTWGNGDGSTTFNLPDLRGYFIRGWDHSRGVDSGRSFASIQNDNIKDHGHVGGTQYEASVQRGSADTPVFAPVNHGEGTGTLQNTAGVAVPNNGGTETRPKNISLMYCIKY